MSITKLRREIAEANRELARVKRDVEESRLKLSQERKRLRELQAEARKRLNTVDGKAVYLSDIVDGVHESILVGRIEGDRFVWHKSYLETYRVGVKEGE